jgi:hypothetical protein
MTQYFSKSAFINARGINETRIAKKTRIKKYFLTLIVDDSADIMRGAVTSMPAFNFMRINKEHIRPMKVTVILE